MALPSEVLAMVLARVPLLDLSNVRQVWWITEYCIPFCRNGLASTTHCTFSTPGVSQTTAAGGWVEQQATLGVHLAGGGNS